MAAAREDHPHLPPGREPGPQSRRGRIGRSVGGCAAPAFALGGVVFAALLAGFGLLLGSLSDGPPTWPFFIGAAAVLVFFWAFARMMWRGSHPRYARDLEVAVERRQVRRGERIGATASGDGELEVGLLCTERYDVWRRIGDSDSRSRVTDVATVWQGWVPAPHAALGQRIELTIPVDGPYSYEGDCVSLSWAVVARRLGEKRLATPVAVWVDP
jgi:hypothetical protein